VACHINTPPPDIIIETDASLEGWGGICSRLNRKTNGLWLESEKVSHINCLELKAILFTLHALCSDFNNKHIRIMTDNTCAVSYINKFGGCKSRKCHDITREIWLWAINRNIWLSCAHISGKDNCNADTLSRSFNSDAEWKLSPHLFQHITLKLDFIPNIDLFASRLNYQLKPFISYQPDPESLATDAFKLHSWEKWKFYAFPPFAVIGLVIQKIVFDKATGLIVVPNWPTQPWYPKLMKMLIKPPIFISRKKAALIAPHNSQLKHRLQHQLCLMACLISGQR
jgi:hypothetical protein